MSCPKKGACKSSKTAGAGFAVGATVAAQPAEYEVNGGCGENQEQVTEGLVVEPNCNCCDENPQKEG